jgi:hypothetical protein
MGGLQVNYESPGLRADVPGQSGFAAKVVLSSPAPDNPVVNRQPWGQVDRLHLARALSPWVGRDVRLSRGALEVRSGSDTAAYQ